MYFAQGVEGVNLLQFSAARTQMLIASLLQMLMILLFFFLKKGTASQKMETQLPVFLCIGVCEKEMSHSHYEWFHMLLLALGHLLLGVHGQNSC